MMRALCLLFTLLGTIAGQQRPTVPAASRNRQPATADQNQPEPMAVPSPVAPESPVLTIQGLCAAPEPDARTAAPSCKTVVTRAQFERLADAVQPEAAPEAKRQLATAYAQFLVMAREAHQRGLDKKPRFGERLAFARLQILSQELIRQIQEDAARVPEKDIELYYQAHLGDFEEVSVERIVIPNQKTPKTQQNEEGIGQAKDAADVMTKEAKALRVRAAAGEEFSKLQREAYGIAGASGPNSPNPSLGKLRRRGLPPAHASVFELRSGQVSQVLSDATGHYIYKIDSREIVPLDAVKQEISNALRQQRMQKTIEGIQQPFTTEVNHAYFGSDADMDSD